MGKRVKILEASSITGLSPYALRKGIAEGRYPHIRTSGGTGKILIDIDLLEQALRQEALNNVQQAPHCAGSVMRYGQLRAVKP